MLHQHVVEILAAVGVRHVAAAATAEALGKVAQQRHTGPVAVDGEHDLLDRPEQVERVGDEAVFALAVGLLLGRAAGHRDGTGEAALKRRDAVELALGDDQRAVGQAAVSDRVEIPPALLAALVLGEIGRVLALQDPPIFVVHHRTSAK